MIPNMQIWANKWGNVGLSSYWVILIFVHSPPYWTSYTHWDKVIIFLTSCSCFSLRNIIDILRNAKEWEDTTLALRCGADGRSIVYSTKTSIKAAKFLADFPRLQLVHMFLNNNCHLGVSEGDGLQFGPKRHYVIYSWPLNLPLHWVAISRPVLWGLLFSDKTI